MHFIDDTLIVILIAMLYYRRMLDKHHPLHVTWHTMRIQLLHHHVCIVHIYG